MQTKRVSKQNYVLSKLIAKCWAAMVLNASDRLAYLQVFSDLYLQVR